MAKKREQGFNATVEMYHTLMDDIKRGGISSLYLLHGEEPYFIDKVSDKLTAIISEDLADFNLEVVYGSDTNAATVIELCRTYPMMSDKRVVVLREAAQMSDINKLESYVDNPSNSTVLVICYKGKSVDKRSAFYKKISKNGIVFESVSARDYEIKNFLSELLQGHGFTIDVKAKELLVEHLGCEVTKIDNEIMKLMNAMDEGVKAITCDHIERYVGISKEYNVFELTDALSARDGAKVLRISSYFNANPKSAPLVLLVPSLFKHFLSIFNIGMTMNDCRRKGLAIPDKYTLAKQAGLASHFFVDKYITAAGYYPPVKSLAIMGYIRDCDMRSKGIGGAALSEGELLRELLLKILNI